MKIKTFDKLVKSYKDYQTAYNLLNLLQSGEYKIKISAISSDFGFCDEERLIINPNNDLFFKIINILKSEINSVESKIEQI